MNALANNREISLEWLAILSTDFQGGNKAHGEVTAQDEDVIFARVQLSF